MTPFLGGFFIVCSFYFSFNHPASTEIYTLSLHDALPIYRVYVAPICFRLRMHRGISIYLTGAGLEYASQQDRKSTRLNSSHVEISYAVFCLKKKKKLFYNSFLLPF